MKNSVENTGQQSSEQIMLFCGGLIWPPISSIPSRNAQENGWHGVLKLCVEKCMQTLILKFNDNQLVLKYWIDKPSSGWWIGRFKLDGPTDQEWPIKQSIQSQTEQLEILLFLLFSLVYFWNFFGDRTRVILDIQIWVYTGAMPIVRRTCMKKIAWRHGLSILFLVLEWLTNMYT